MSQKTDNLIKLALVFFVSLLSFSIGTYVGKKYSDNQHKLALLEPQKDAAPVKTSEEFATESAAAAAIEPEKHLGEIPAEKSVQNAAGDEKPTALTDSEVAKIAEEFASEDDATEEKVVATIEPNEKVVKTIPDQPKIKEPVAAKKVLIPAATAPAPSAAIATVPVKKSEPVAVAQPKVEKVLPKKIAALPPKLVKTNAAPPETEVVTPTPSDSSERVPASIPPTTEMIPIHYTVQIGSFPTETEADSLTKSLQNKGYKTSYVPAKVNGQTWYRVNVGLFGTIREAQDYKKEFLEKTKLSSAIVQRLQH
jgi:cell division protein FtsN